MSDTERLSSGSDDSLRVRKEAFEWTWSIKLGIIAVTENTEPSIPNTSPMMRRTRPSILILTREPDERNAAQYLGVTLYVAWNSIESDVCCPSQFTPCCCHPPRVCLFATKKQRNQIEIFSCSDLNRVVSQLHN